MARSATNGAAKPREKRELPALPSLPVQLGITVDGIVNLATGDLVEWGTARRLISAAKQAGVVKAKIAHKAETEAKLKERKARLQKQVKSVDEQLAELAKLVREGELSFDQAVGKVAKIKPAPVATK